MREFFVAPTGDDSNTGTADEPFRTINQGIGTLQPGDILNIRGGRYRGPVIVRDKHGTQSEPIVIRCDAGVSAAVESCLPTFQRTASEDWLPARQVDSRAHADEYVSREAVSRDDFPFRGAFYKGEYTRLITYSRLEDLRAENERWGELALADPRPGFEVINTKRPFKRPFVYMGPGICTGPTGLFSGNRIHIRLSHTHNGVPGLADYDGETDPRNIALAIMPDETAALTVRDSSFIHIENLTLRFGGAATLRLRQTQGVVLDHVRIFAGAQGMSLADTVDTVIRHCEIRGGLPSWYFRTDRKGVYEFLMNGIEAENLLGQHTSSALIGCESNTNLEIHHCELSDGHDLQLSGLNVHFHHNWIHNLNDEALLLNKEPAGNVHIFQNAMTQCLSALSFAGRFPGGPRFVYRNLIDLRSPTASRRPACADDPEVMRFGHLYKGGGASGPLDLVQNTFLVRSVSDRHASYTHYENADQPSEHARRSFNNIFVAVNPRPDSDKPIALLPAPTFPGPTDGNCYFRVGHAQEPLLQFKNQRFATLETFKRDDLFTQSQTQYPPGYEAASIAEDPRFLRIAADGTPQPDDDLRPTDNIPGIELTDLELPFPDPEAPESGRPDMGCYPANGESLRVGVDGRKRFPQV